MTSDATFPTRFTRIDDLTRPDHSYLTGEDSCYFLGEYTARKGYAYSATNNLIVNFKKTMDRRGRPEWQHKGRAIRQAAGAFGTALGARALDRLTFVPVPPSKAKGDPLHDDRLPRMLCAIRREPRLDVRELVVQSVSTGTAHGSDVRPRPERIEALYRIVEASIAPAPRTVAIVDDILTTGAHFRAMHAVLSACFPETPIVGLFIARRAPDASGIGGCDDAEP